MQFIIKRDPNKVFQFASLQSDIGKALLDSYQISNKVDSVILIEENQVYIKSTAVLRICKRLTGWWKYLYILIIVPPPIRHKVYDVVARNRYLFGRKNNACVLPSKEDLERFLS